MIHDLQVSKKIKMSRENSRISFVLILRFLLLQIIFNLHNAVVAFAIHPSIFTSLSDFVVSVIIEKRETNSNGDRDRETAIF